MSTAKTYRARDSDHLKSAFFIPQALAMRVYTRAANQFPRDGSRTISSFRVCHWGRHFQNFGDGRSPTRKASRARPS